MKAIILAGGTGSRLWPYNSIRNKAMVPVANRPLVQHSVDALHQAGIDEIVIAGWHHMDDVSHHFRGDPAVRVAVVEPNKGSADTLAAVMPDQDFMFLMGDVLAGAEDVARLAQAAGGTVLLAAADDDPHNHIIAQLQDGRCVSFIGHPRGLASGSWLVGGRFDGRLKDCLTHCASYFPNTKVGVAAPDEHIVEAALNDYAAALPLTALPAASPALDIDKPWQILQANAALVARMCAKLDHDVLDPTAAVDPTARIQGHVSLGPGSRIGPGVVVKGRAIIGAGTLLDNGAVIIGDAVIGDGCTLANGCKVTGPAVIGDECIMEQTAELAGGVVMRKNYLYHHGEFFGLLGQRCDLGAGCLSGSLRFDDGAAVQTVKGRREHGVPYANATYVGDFTRAGVGVMFMPGVKVGTGCAIGPGTIVDRDIPDNRLVYVKQELIDKQWGPDRYGW